MGANTGIQAHALDDRLGVQTFGLGIGIQLVEIADTHGKICIGEQLDGLRLRRMADKRSDVLILRAFLQKIGKHGSRFRLLFISPHHDTAGMQVIIKRLGLSQKLRAEDNVVDTVLLPHGIGIPHGDRRFDDHQHIGVDLQHRLDGVLHGGGVKEMVLIVVVRRRGDDDQLRRPVRGLLVCGRGKVQLAAPCLRLPEETLDLIVLDGADELVQLLCLCLGGSDSCHLMVLRQQHRQGEPYISNACHGDLHGLSPKSLQCLPPIS